MKNIVARFKDEEKLEKALGKLRDKKVNMIDVYGPFARHGILKKITKPSILPYLAILFGAVAIVTMFAFLYYTSVIDYPINYGGKPYFSFPPMIVLMYLFTILLTTILSTLAFHGLAFIFPGKPAAMIDNNIIDRSVTDDSFFLVLDQNYNPEEIKGWLQEYGADEITEKDIQKQ